MELLMPLITVELFEGRSVEQKRQIVAGLTKTMCDLTGGKPSAVQVMIRDVPKSNWGFGGELCSDLFADK
jgi:4-oxalocrotonate tautomerase|tara:strand:- start:1247 stop:1456 length:210 start_codon:yes stop_codon:yes gene_type:complete